MGRHKNEMRKIHRRKLKKARLKIKLFEKGQLDFEHLPALSKKILAKREKASSKT